MAILIRVPHGFLRRHLSAVERVLVAAGMGVALYQLMVSLPAYPTSWEIVVAVTVFLVMLWSPPVAYFLAVIAALYPLYSVSMYLAVLFLAVALLGQRVFIHNLGATLLVLLAPWLAQYHLEWTVVLLGGLWWGKTGGAWIGGLAALWGQLLFGMAGQSPNWLDMMGIQPAAQGLFAQFKTANSLDTLKLIITPFAPNPTLLLYHLLQIVLWAMAAGLVGGIVERSWAQQKHPWRAILIGLLGAGAVALSNLGLAYWLEQYKPKDFAWLIPGLIESALYAGIASVALEAVRDFIEHPLPVFGRARQTHPAQTAGHSWMRIFTGRRPAAGTANALNIPVRVDPTGLENPGDQTPGAEPAAGPYQPLPVPANLPRRGSKKQRPDDTIKIELD